MPTIKELSSLTPEAVSKMTEKELKKVVSTLASAANKRVARLRESDVGQYSPAYQKAMTRAYRTDQGGVFGVKGKNLNQLRNEYKAVVGYLNLQTSSIKGFKQVKSKLYNRLGVNLSKSQESAMWSAYRKLTEISPLIETRDGVRFSAYGSDNVQRDLAKLVKGESPRDFIDSINSMTVPKDYPFRDQYIKELSRNGEIYTTTGSIEKFDFNDTDDIVRAMSIKIDAAYEEEQTRQLNDREYNQI